MPRSGRGPPRRAAHGAWVDDDDAWAATSDDDEFVARIATEPVALSAPSPPAPPAWTLVTSEPPGAEQHSHPTRKTSGASAAAPSAAAAAAADNDEQTFTWAERHMALGSPHLGATPPTVYLEAVVEDPMFLLAKCKARTYTMSPPSTPKDESAPPPLPTEDVGTWIGAAAFDPLATMSDGVFTTPSLPPPPPPPPPSSPPRAPAARLERRTSSRTLRNRHRLVQCLQSEHIDMAVLRSLAWKGVPPDLRPIVWPILLGYLPPTAALRTSTLARKRAEYASGVERAFRRESLDRAAWHQIRIDVPRTNPGLRLWQQAETQRALERILYVWAIRHPASGYVQGINDLVTPFFEVCLSAYTDTDPETFELASLPRYVREALEADTFWCMSRLLDGIQDNYIFAQPGILRQLSVMSDVVQRMDPELHAHLAEQGVEYMQFSFRWMNCLLMREMSVKSIIRIWDTYLAEGADSFAGFHPFVCAVFLHRWREALLTMDFQGMIMFLQSLPTQHWSDKDAEMLLSEAFMYKSLFGNSAHIGS